MEIPPNFDPEFVDFNAYMNARYSPPPALVALAAEEPFWRTLGGSTADWTSPSPALRSPSP